MKILLSALYVAFFASIADARPDPNDPIWNKFIAGNIKDIPNEAVREFVFNAQNRNPYAETIQTELSMLGPFAPGKNRVFWLPSIHLPLTERNWRFLSGIKDAPKHLQNLAIVEKNGKPYIRMVLHPYSSQEAVFQDMAKANGGFHYEFQGATTASVRSLVVWKTSRDLSEINGEGIDFPASRDRVFQAKVSIYGVDIDGSRLNPAKKMVRAAAVTRVMEAIPQSTRDKLGFDFSGEWIIGVPDGTDAGFVYREMLHWYKADAGKHIEPGHATLSPVRLDQIASGQGDRFGAVMDRLFQPVAKVFVHLFLEEMMVGEFHSQNYGYEVDSKGMPTGRIVLHDADSFRVNIQGRVLNQRAIDPMRELDNPFFYAKDSIFTATQNADGESYTLNALLEYFVDRGNDRASMVGAIYHWCSAMSVVPQWCTKKKIRQEALNRIAALMSEHLGREVSPKEIDVASDAKGSVGMMAIFKERLRMLASKYEAGSVDAKSQLVLFREFERLQKTGRARLYGSDVNLKNSIFFLHDFKGSKAISVHSVSNPDSIRGMAVLEPDHTPATRRLFKQIGRSSGCSDLDSDFGRDSSIFDRLPLQRNMGGGNNIAELDHWEFLIQLAQ